MKRPAAKATLVTALAASTAVGHVGYPALLAALTRGRRPVPPTDPATWPAITVIVPAFREAGVIAAKLKSVLANDYPGPLELLVVAEDQETADAARQIPEARVLQPEARLGKSQAVNLAVEHAAHDVLVMTDANNQLFPEALANLVRRLGPGIGAVAGAKSIASDDGESVYWRFESWLKERESVLGSTIGIVGELFAVRREAWEPIPAGIGMDDFWVSLDLHDRGWRVAYAPDAITSEPPVGTLAEEWERRTKLTAGALAVYWGKRHLIWRGGLPAMELVGHRLWRSTVGPLTHVALLGMAVGSVRRSRLARLFLAGHVVGVAAIWWPTSARPLPTPVRAAGQALFLQGVALGGMARRLRGDRVATWEKAAR